MVTKDVTGTIRSRGSFFSGDMEAAKQADGGDMDEQDDDDEVEEQDDDGDEEDDVRFQNARPTKSSACALL